MFGSAAVNDDIIFLRPVLRVVEVHDTLGATRLNNVNIVYLSEAEFLGQHFCCVVHRVRPIVPRPNLVGVLQFCVLTFDEFGIDEQV
jgi:hypothetical protein